MGKNYLFFASVSYAYSILRPLQDEIRRRGDNAAWYLEGDCPDMLMDNEIRLYTLGEIKKYNPIAVFSPTVWVYDFFPGIKVMVFHGYPINKRCKSVDNHFRMRGWFDIFCTQGDSSTIKFKELERELGYFKTYETGWCKVDSFYTPRMLAAKPDSNSQTIFVATTFSKGISLLSVMYPEIKRLVQNKPWKWVITMHPKVTDAELIDKYKELAAENSNVTYLPLLNDITEMAKTDVMLCDSSSIIIEYMLLDKPVVTFRNTNPGNHLLNVTETADIEAALEKALTRPDDLMEHVRAYTRHHEAHRDGRNSARILDAVDDFLANHKGRIKRKPLNLFRKIKMRFRFLFKQK